MSATRTKQPIGVILKRARLRNKLSAEAVAASCNVSRSRVYQWEAGNYVFPKNLSTLSEVLHVPVGRLKAANKHSPRGTD